MNLQKPVRTPTKLLMLGKAIRKIIPEGAGKLGKLDPLCQFRSPSLCIPPYSLRAGGRLPLPVCSHQPPK